VANFETDSTERAIFVIGEGQNTVSNITIGDAEGVTFPGQYNIQHRAIWVQYSKENVISGNTITNARGGIDIRGGRDNMVSNK